MAGMQTTCWFVQTQQQPVLQMHKLHVILLYAGTQCSAIGCQRQNIYMPSFAAVSAVDDASQQKDTAAQAAAAPEPAQSLRPLMVQYYSKRLVNGWHQQHACLSSASKLDLQLSAVVLPQMLMCHLCRQRVSLVYAGRTCTSLVYSKSRLVCSTWPCRTPVSCAADVQVAVLWQRCEGALLVSATASTGARQQPPPCTLLASFGTASSTCTTSVAQIVSLSRLSQQSPVVRQADRPMRRSHLDAVLCALCVVVCRQQSRCSRWQLLKQA